ncbi:MAG TPA: tRNA epoxyqueuosine(34) reductase QueG [Planctomycetia bacterium]|nr:tRNA epoxyqueuosine(34) reductase QueG [Planctomycetia bacterium]
MNPQSASAAVKRAATTAGFDLCGIAPAVAGLGSERLAAWLAAGKHGDMAYMATHAAARDEPDRVLAGIRSVAVVGLGYRTEEPQAPAPGEAKISRYAWGRDYHDVLREKLRTMADVLREEFPSAGFRGVVDTTPTPERDYAQLAGLGWFGKNTLLLNRKFGSFLFLGALLSTLELEPDAPFAADHCGSCTRCLEACPTQAFDGPYRLDPRKCIAYLTIERKGPVSPEISSKLGDWVFGCDVCQDVCPWNRKAERVARTEFEPAAGRNPVKLDELLAMDEDEFRRTFRGTPLFRTKRERVQENARIVAENQAKIS